MIKLRLNQAHWILNISAEICTQEVILNQKKEKTFLVSHFYTWYSVAFLLYYNLQIKISQDDSFKIKISNWILITTALNIYSRHIMLNRHYDLKKWIMPDIIIILICVINLCLMIPNSLSMKKFNKACMYLPIVFCFNVL